jgi:acyl-CoA thioester hydrolase
VREASGVRREAEQGGSRVVETALRVRYSETDQMGIVYHSHYLVWFEIGRTEWCRAAGLPYTALEHSGIFIPVTRAEGTFRRRSRYDDPIRVLTRMRSLASRGCSFAYEIRNPAGDLLAEGVTDHVFTDASGRPSRAPEQFVRPLAQFRGSPA